MRRRWFLALALCVAFGPAPLRAEEVGRFYLHLLQQQLLLHGYDPGPASGEMNGRTRWAAARYRQDAGLPPGSDLLEVLTHLRFAAPRVMAKPRPGMRATAPVAAAQFLLQKLGYFVPPLDGRMGEETRAAVETYRRDHGLPGAGVVDEPLIASLTEAARRRGVQVPSVIAALRIETP
jgi:peptidoglycan hydrolase-like protein with peptidoglycan-binding domain